MCGQTLPIFISNIFIIVKIFLTPKLINIIEIKIFYGNKPLKYKISVWSNFYDLKDIFITVSLLKVFLPFLAPAGALTL